MTGGPEVDNTSVALSECGLCGHQAGDFLGLVPAHRFQGTIPTVWLSAGEECPGSGTEPELTRQEPRVFVAKLTLGKGWEAPPGRFDSPLADAPEPRDPREAYVRYMAVRFDAAQAQYDPQEPPW